MACNYILYEKSDNIAWVTLNRPEKMNALTPEMLEEWRSVLIDSGKDEDVGVVVVTGAGRAFCSGLDLGVVRDNFRADGSVGPLFDEPAHALIETMLTLPKVIISMVNGACIAGGLELLLASDLIVASEEAVFRDPHTHWGMKPSWGMSQRLPRTIGLMQARELSFTARYFSAKEAFEMNLINRVVPADQLKQETIVLAKMILDNSREALSAFKSLYNQGLATTLAEGLKIEHEARFEITGTAGRLDGFIKKP